MPAKKKTPKARKKTAFVPKFVFATAFAGAAVIPACGGKTSGSSGPEPSVALVMVDSGVFSVADSGFRRDSAAGVAIDAFGVADIGFTVAADAFGVAIDAFGVADTGFTVADSGFAVADTGFVNPPDGGHDSGHDSGIATVAMVGFDASEGGEG